MLFDAHSHISYTPSFPMVCCATSEDDWEALLQVSQKNGIVYPALGVHPWFLHTLKEGWKDRLRLLIEDSDASIGECGLDFIKGKENRALQEEVFAFHLQLAKEYNRPLSIHMVKGWPLLEKLVQQIGLPTCGALLHGYSGSEQMISTLEKRGFYFSFGKEICDERFKKSRAALKAVSLERLLLETDSLEDSSCEEQLKGTLSIVAKLKDISEERLLQVLWENGERLFGI